jgi:phospho-N-acetylmuramoyl-pentapeptide-transferase
MYQIEVVKIFIPAVVSFFVGLAMAPSLIKILLKNKMWKKVGVTKTIDGREATISNSLHNDEAKKTPRMGGIVVWASVFITSLLFWLIGRYVDGAARFDFISRSQTWLPLATMLGGAAIGFVDDYAVTGGLGNYIGGGLSLRVRVLFVALFGALTGYWFFIKLGMSSIFIPFLGFVDFGLLFVPALMIVMIAIFSGGIIDGIDGLSGGIMSSIFVTYGIIAILNNQIDIATFCFVVAGSILAFLWFNIPPAKFFMSETGMLGLTTSITVVAFMTGAVFELLIIAFPLFTASGSSIIQILSKRFRKGKKIFLVAPVHNHFQAKGMPGYAVTMHYWIISCICGLTGIIVYIIR